MGQPDRFEVVAAGRDAAELAAMLRWPAIDGGFGFRDLPREAATLRYLAARRLVDQLGLELELPEPGVSGGRARPSTDG
ncbi:MAG: hypothetical protein ABMA64_25240 [Myxococcota bacterium]